MAPAERLPKNKKAEQPCAQGNSAINMNLTAFRPHRTMGLPLIGKFTEKYTHIKRKHYIYTREKSYKSIQKYHSL
jgi:hypothetical protein